MFGLAVLSSACGGADAGSFGVSVSRQALSADIVRAEIAVHPGTRRCEELRDAGPALPPSYILEVDLGGGGALEGQGTIEELRSGLYSVVVWGFPGDTVAPVAYGCAEEVVVSAGKRTRVTLRLVPYGG